MRTLLLMRHAKSSWKDPGLSDHERPLNARGRAAAPKMGELLRKQELLPDLILCSSAVRAFDTAEHVVAASGCDAKVDVTRRLYLAEPDGYLDVLSEVEPSHRCVLMVGHNPGISELVSELTGEDTSMPTAAVARIDLEVDSFADVNSSTRGRLRGFWKPKELD